MANVFEPSYDDTSEREGFAGRRARIGRQAGAEHLGASLFELEPGSAPFPLHFHLGNEEMVIVLAGTPSLRTPVGERDLEPGEVVAFPRGEQGAHQVINRTGERARTSWCDPSRTSSAPSGARPARPGRASTTSTSVVTRSTSGTARSLPLRAGERSPGAAARVDVGYLRAGFGPIAPVVVQAHPSGRVLARSAPLLPLLPPRRERTGCAPRRRAWSRPGSAPAPPPSRR